MEGGASPGGLRQSQIALYSLYGKKEGLTFHLGELSVFQGRGVRLECKGGHRLVK